MAFFWLATIAAAIAAAMLLAFGLLLGGGGAPQQAAVAAIALAVAVIPYVFTRALDGMAQSSWRKKMLAALKSDAGKRPD